MSGPVAIIIGPPGAGKSTVGELLAAKLGVPFTDADSVIEETAGKPVSDIFVQDGEAAFRALERATAAQLIGDAPRGARARRRRRARPGYPAAAGRAAGHLPGGRVPHRGAPVGPGRAASADPGEPARAG